MILKGRSRADGGKLASYLLSSKNEQVRVLGIRGTVEDERSARGLRASLKDMDELGKMTKAQSPLFHLAINPNDRDQMTRDDWQYSVAKAEKALGLEGQPRAVVSHIKDGKEHLHVVWSRVNVETRKCVQLSFTHLKLGKTAREIEIELGLKRTPERARGEHRLKQHIKDLQHQQDERAAKPNARQQRNEMVSAAWQQSNSSEEFKEQIEAAGYRLAIGNRGVLLVDSNNEPHSISRCVGGIKAKDVKAKLGELRDLPTVEELRPPKARKSETDEAKSNKNEPQRQRARNMTRAEAKRERLAANDNTPPDIKARGAQHLTQSGFELRIAEPEKRKGPAP